MSSWMLSINFAYEGGVRWCVVVVAFLRIRGIGGGRIFWWINTHLCFSVVVVFVCVFCLFLVEISSRTQIHSLNQDQSKMAKQVETTADERSLTSCVWTRVPNEEFCDITAFLSHWFVVVYICFYFLSFLSVSSGGREGGKREKHAEGDRDCQLKPGS